MQWAVLTWPATHEQVEAASKLVPDEIVQMLTASGTPDEAKAAVAQYIENGCTSPILYLLGDVKATIQAFSNWSPRGHHNINLSSHIMVSDRIL